MTTATCRWTKSLTSRMTTRTDASARIRPHFKAFQTRPFRPRFLFLQRVKPCPKWKPKKHLCRQNFPLAPRSPAPYTTPHAATNNVLQTSGGAIAQLVERLNGIQEVRGSTPLGSTNVPQQLEI